MPLRKPDADETQAHFMAYCVSELASADTERPQDQRVAICLRAWRSGQAEKFVQIVERATTIIKGASR